MVGQQKLSINRPKKLKRLVNNKDGGSQRKLAGRFQCTQSYVNRAIKIMGIQKYKKQKIPNRSDQQKEVKRAKCATTKTAV